jgi:hypothetical protein
MNKLRQFFDQSPRLATKYSNYFDIYDSLLSSYRGKKITIVEIGVADGGSLHMWRNYFGDTARIIGIDYNPTSSILADDGFEIYIGSQSDSKFLTSIFKKIGPIDLIIDDGGHSNLQTLTTLSVALDYINDGGMIVFEDTHSSYMFLYSNPSRHSFINYTRLLIDHIHSRSPNVRMELKNMKYRKAIFSIEYFDSIVALKVDRRLCVNSIYVSNNSKGLIDDSNRGAVSNGSKLISGIFSKFYYRQYSFADSTIKSFLMMMRSFALYIRGRREVSDIKRLDFK